MKIDGQKNPLDGLAQNNSLNQKPTAESTLTNAQNLATRVRLSSSFTQQAFVTFDSSLQRSLGQVFNQPAQNTDETKRLENINFFDFEKIAENVLKFVGGVINKAKSNGADDEKLTELFSQAREGVANGIGQARQELGDSISEEVDEGINRADQLIENGLVDLEDKVFGRASTVVGGEYEARQSFQLNLQTLQGDNLTIDFSRQESASFEINQEQQSGQLSVANSSRFSISVQGELNEDESAAISRFLEDVTDVASEFFNGDIESAFEQALSLGLDTEQLTSAKLSLNSQQSVSAYQSVQQNTALPNGLAPLADYRDSLFDLLDKGEKVSFDRENTLDALDQVATNLFPENLVDAKRSLNEINSSLLNR